MTNSENSSLFGKWALALLVVGVLGSIALAALSLPVAAVFAGASLLLTLAFGIAGWRQTTGKVAVIGAVVCMVIPMVIGILLVIWPRPVRMTPGMGGDQVREPEIASPVSFPAEESAPAAAQPAPAAPKPGDLDTVDLGGGVKMELVWVPAGSFQMGCPDLKKAQQTDPRVEWGIFEGPPAHRVEVDGFWLGRYEVTQEQYEAVMGTNPSDCKGAKNPVEKVSWNDAADFCEKLSTKTGRAFRLPTEAEWEYACRAGSNTRYCFGDSDSEVGDYAWHSGNSDRQTHPVGEKKPNAWGLYDMHGNVFEWCGDWAGGNYDANLPSKNPQGTRADQMWVYRGGSYWYSAISCRSACRGFSPSNYRGRFNGLRLAMTLSSAATVKLAPANPDAVNNLGAPKLSNVTGQTTESLDLGGGVKMELVWVPAGSFQMGSPDSEPGRADDEGPVHTVDLDGFWMGKYEVTQEQYESVIGKNPSYFKGAKNPVEMVSWNDAADFCRKLTDKVGRASSPASSGRTFRLPTEAEWEYACRAGSSTRFCFGDSDSGLGEYAWYLANSTDKTHPVGEKKPNAWGLYDMHGNVWEWCGDWWAEKYGVGAAKNPQGPSSVKYPYRVCRSGSWNYDPRICRSARRGWSTVSSANNRGGLRVVCVSRSQ